MVLVMGTLVRDVTGPPMSRLVRELKKPWGEVVVVHVEAGWVIVIVAVVVTTEATVVWTGEVMIWTADTTPVDSVTKVAAGWDEVIV